VGLVETSLVTVEETADNLGQTISQTRPLLEQISVVASQDVPNGIEQFQAAIPDMAEAAAAIDTTLRTLNDFQIDTTIPIVNYPIEYDLGINYDPVQPFDQTVEEIGSSLENIPPRLRSLEIYINVADENLDQASRNLHEISDNLAEINSSVGDFEPLLDEYSQSVTETNDLIRQARESTAQQVASIKNTLTLIFVWFGLTQIAPIYLGMELAMGARKAVVIEKTAG
jgi:chromosome segregation ATPase